MGKDNQPRDRLARKLARKKPTRKSYDRVLVVCEGTKTEPQYFNEIRTAHRLNSNLVKIIPCQTGTAPLQIVKYAHNIFSNGDSHRGIAKKAFDQVYAVFDRDDHLSYQEALALSNQLNGILQNDEGNIIPFASIPSVPNFEIWFLNHFALIKHEINRADVITQLKQYMPNYTKGHIGCFSQTRAQLTTAFKNANILLKGNPLSGMAYTKVGCLVDVLMKLKI